MIKKTYSFEKNGRTNEVYTFTNAQGAQVEIFTYGARLHRILVPDKKGKLGDILVGCRRVENYYEENPYFGATVGRYANRIGGGKFTLNGKEYTLEKNDGENTLHGGNTANFDRVVWDAKIEGDRLVLTHVSPDGAGGFPGTLTVTLTVSFSDENELVLDYQAVSDKDTLCNLTNHSYFNLGGQDTVLDHELMINSRKITPTDDSLIPHGEYMDIDGTPYSFLFPKTLGKDMFSDAPLIKLCNGFDFNYCLDRIGKGLEHFAYVYDKASGRRMDCYTTLPGVQLYTGCSTGSFTGKGKRHSYVNHCALCLETQGYPNSPNCPQYPSTVLKAGEKYHEITAYRFSVKP